MTMKTLLLVVTFLTISLALKAPLKTERKQLAGPPSQFKDMALPPVEKSAMVSDYTMIDFFLKPDGSKNTLTWHGSYTVDTHDVLKAMLISPHMDDLELHLKAPGYTEYVHLNEDFFKQPEVRGFVSVGPFGIDGNEFQAKTFTFYDIDAGDYEIEVRSTKPITQNPGHPDGLFLLDSYSDYFLYSHVNTYMLEEGQAIGLVAQMSDHKAKWRLGDAGRPSPVSGIEHAVMEVIFPDGHEEDIDMKDDGLHADLGANDGVYAATINVKDVGSYVYRATVDGTTADGYHFTRSSSHIIEIVPPQLTLTGVASESYDAKTHTLSFHINVDEVESASAPSSADGTTVLAYAQLWGTDTSGHHYVPVAWMEAMVDPIVDSDAGITQVTLDIDENWVHLAEASAPFQLREVQLLDRNTLGLLSHRSEIFVKSKSEAQKTLLEKTLRMGREASIKDSIEITEKMLVGPRPERLLKVVNSTALPAGVLILVHGYCSGSVWDEADFTNAREFQDYKQSRSNDDFALRIKEFADSVSSSCSLIGHSQGGMATAHLNTFYWSNCDNSEGGRKIQSVGTPYQGCSLAGTLASIGSWFGAGCGSNYDLSTTGAASWAPKIPEERAASTYYYTTTYNSGWLSSNCVTGTSIVLYKPNDGTTETRFRNLNGAHDMGNTEGWCHASEMKYPAQTTDKTRNSEMNAAAAR